jgi:hypothetical protein
VRQTEVLLLLLHTFCSGAAFLLPCIVIHITQVCLFVLRGAEVGGGRVRGALRGGRQGVVERGELLQFLVE